MTTLKKKPVDSTLPAIEETKIDLGTHQEAEHTAKDHQEESVIVANPEKKELPSNGKLASDKEVIMNPMLKVNSGETSAKVSEGDTGGMVIANTDTELPSVESDNIVKGEKMKTDEEVVVNLSAATSVSPTTAELHEAEQLKTEVTDKGAERDTKDEDTKNEVTRL